MGISHPNNASVNCFGADYLSTPLQSHSFIPNTFLDKKLIGPEENKSFVNHEQTYNLSRKHKSPIQVSQARHLETVSKPAQHPKISQQTKSVAADLEAELDSEDNILEENEVEQAHFPLRTTSMIFDEHDLELESAPFAIVRLHSGPSFEELTEEPVIKIIEPTVEEHKQGNPVEITKGSSILYYYFIL